MSSLITERRDKRFKDVIAKRQLDLTVILENVHDPHNIGAVMRSCDAVGLHEIYIVYTEKKLQKEGIVGKTSSSGTKKWIKVNYFEDLKECMDAVKSKYKSIFATHLGNDSKDLYDVDWTGSIALLFGNEHDGVSDQALTYCDGNFIIPQNGMVQSLNISVACAVSLFEAQRQRRSKGFYDRQYDENFAPHQELYDHYYAMQLMSKAK